MQQIIDFYSTNSEEDSAEYWVKNITEDKLFSEIISSVAFSRLYDISFLGSLDYTKSRLNNTKLERSRAHHSLHVAALAKYISSKRNYSKHTTNHLVAAALLHDIGHPPFSHSAEPSIKKQLGYGHHEMGESIIRGKEKEIGLPLNKILSKHFDIDLIINLLDKKVDQDYGGDLFSSEINIDTIDGIIRSIGYHTNIKPSITIEIATASFLQSHPDQEGTSILDGFWQKKDFVYNKIINSRRGVLQDKICEYYFENEKEFPEEDFIKPESSLKRRYHDLFYALNNSDKLTTYPRWIDGKSIDYTHREYTVNFEEHGLKRYTSKKIPKKLETSNHELNRKMRDEGSDNSRIPIDNQWFFVF